LVAATEMGRKDVLDVERWRLQGVLPLNPTDVDGVPSALAFNTAASFVSNTTGRTTAASRR
jgi:K+-transporting ATPase A subunit